MDTESSTSESDSEIGSQLRHRRKRTLDLSTSSDSSFSSSVTGSRRRKRVHVMSTSETSDEDSLTVNSDEPSTSRRLRNRLVPDRPRPASYNSSNFSSEESSDSSLDNLLLTVRRARQMESDISSQVRVVPQPRTVASVQASGSLQRMTTPRQPVTMASSELSDSGDDTEAEKCPICFRKIRNQEVGSPEGCDHTFCLVCLVQWAKNNNMCPMDRQPFTIILVRDHPLGEVVRQLEVEDRPPAPVEEAEDNMFCMVCGRFDREDRMLLCDSCNRGYHLDCLTPPLSEIPEVEEWFCPSCINMGHIETSVVIQAPQVRRPARRGRPRRRTANGDQNSVRYSRLAVQLQRALHSLSNGTFSEVFSILDNLLGD